MFLLGNRVLWANTRSEIDIGTFFVDGTWEPPDGQVNITDAVAALDKFRNLPWAPRLALADLYPQMPDGDVDIVDVFQIILAFAGHPHPYEPLPECP